MLTDLLGSGLQSSHSARFCGNHLKKSRSSLNSEDYLKMTSGRKEILIAGIALFTAGIILGLLTYLSFLRGAYSLSIIETISPGGSYNDYINMTFVYLYNKPGVNMSLAVDSEPPYIPMNIQIRQPNLVRIVDIDFNDILFTTFRPTDPGQYIVTISNLGTTDPATVRIETGTTSFLSTSAGTTPEAIFPRNLSLAAFMIFGGAGVLIYGGIILWINEKRKERKKSKTIPSSSSDTGYIKQQQQVKPTGLRIYTILTGFAGIFTIIMMSDFIPMAVLALPLDDDNNRLLFMIAVMISIGITYLVIMAGLLYFKRRWIWTMAVIMSFVSIALSLIIISLPHSILSLDYSHQYATTLASIIINGTLLYYLYRPYVKVYFGNTTPNSSSASATV